LTWRCRYHATTASRIARSTSVRSGTMMASRCHASTWPNVLHQIVPPLCSTANRRRRPARVLCASINDRLPHAPPASHWSPTIWPWYSLPGPSAFTSRLVAAGTRCTGHSTTHG
jgi:hypothetical protein